MNCEEHILKYGKYKFPIEKKEINHGLRFISAALVLFIK